MQHKPKRKPYSYVDSFLILFSRENLAKAPQHPFLDAPTPLHRAAALLLFPGLLAPPLLPFILAAEKERMSALLAASPLLLWRLRPPKPYFWSRFWRLALEPAPGPRSRPERSLELGFSMSTVWKRSSSRLPSLTLPVSAPLRSVREPRS